VSIIIPASNAASVIVETLESLRLQTFQDFEALIVDDGSTDDTAAIAQNFCEANPRFFLIRQGNGGVSAARNTAITRARGEWLAFLDADDVWLPRKLERQMELSRQDPRANFLFTNYFYWDGHRDLHPAFSDEEPLPEGDVTRKLIWADPYGLSTVMIRRQTLLAAGSFDPAASYSQDWDMFLRICERELWARGVREPLVRYRRWPGSRTTNRLKSAEGNAEVIRRRLHKTTRPDLREWYRRSFANKLAECEMARARILIETNPGAVPALTWRAWKHEYRLKWLRWYFLLVWPKILGGNLTRQTVHRKIFSRY
jgi:glycosyltransferase involved in cell wall biosynthesis